MRYTCIGLLTLCAYSQQIDLGPGTEIKAVTHNASGDTYAAGTTSSFHLPGAHNHLNGPADAFVAKLNPAGTAVVWSHYLGGSGVDVATGIALNPDGSLTVSGYTNSSDFPGTVADGAFSVQLETIETHGPGGVMVFSVTSKSRTGGISRNSPPAPRVMNTAVSQYTFFHPQDDSLATEGTNFTAINNKGVVAGSYINSHSNGNALTYSAGTYTNLPNDQFAVNGTYPSGINDAGTIVGYYSDESFNHGFTFNGTNYTTIDDALGAHGTNVFAINNSGKMAGSYQDVNNVFHGFSYDGSNFPTIDHPLGTAVTEIRGINNTGKMVGFYSTTEDPATFHGFIYDGTNFTAVDFPGAAGGTLAFGINDSGLIVGQYRLTANGHIHGFYYDGTTFTTLDDPVGVRGTIPLGVNNAGQIAGIYLDANFTGHPFIAPALTVAAISGGGQASVTGMQFTMPLKAKVTNNIGTPVSGVTVIFAGPASGASATFANSGQAVTDVNGIATITPTANGTLGGYTVNASVTGAATPAAFSLTNATAQTIAFTQPADHAFGDAPFNLVATATSGLTVTFTSNSTSVCTVSGAQVTIVGAGACSITANQHGSSAYAPAPAVVRTFNVFPKVSVTQTGFVRNRATGIWSATLTVKNTGPVSLNAPIEVVLTNLTAGVSMTNSSGTHNGSPYITVMGSGSLAPGMSVSVPIQFTNPSNGLIGFTPVTYSGAF